MSEAQEPDRTKRFSLRADRNDSDHVLHGGGGGGGGGEVQEGGERE